MSDRTFTMPDYIRTFTGAKFHAMSPLPQEVDILDIAHGLAIAPRWGGHSKYRYPVLAHSLFVARMLPDHLKFQGLMHDASEAYLCDLPSPIKATMPQYRENETRLMDAIAARFGFDWPPHYLVKTADAVALYVERECMFDSDPGEDVPKMAEHPELNYNFTWNFKKWGEMPLDQIKKEFLDHFKVYQAIAGRS